MVVSDRDLSGLQPSYGIRNDPSPVTLRFGLAGDRQRFSQSAMALKMALVENTLEAVRGSPPFEVHNNMVHSKEIKLLHPLLPPKAPTNPNSRHHNDRLHDRLLLHWIMGL
jgi:hypothetical protein